MIRLALCLCVFACTALAADVDPSRCRDIDDTTRHLVPAQLHPWNRFEHAVRACPAFSKRHTFLWWIITVDLEAEPEVLMSDPILHPLNPDGFTRRGWPRPYIIDRTGHELGRLSDAFPTGGEPSRTELFFSQWVDDFPRHIAIKVSNARVRGDFSAPPLQWNIRTGHYDQIGKGLFDDDP
jgi:hypothetical protein